MVVLGIGLRKNAEVCASGIYLCVIFYGTSKLLIYLFLSEFGFSLIL